MHTDRNFQHAYLLDDFLRILCIQYVVDTFTAETFETRHLLSNSISILTLLLMVNVPRIEEFHVNSDFESFPIANSAY